MTLAAGHLLHATAVAPHVTTILPSAAGGLSQHPFPANQDITNVLLLVAGYLIALVVLVVFGLCMGWQSADKGGNGRGGLRRPPVPGPPSPGGRELDGDSVQQVLADDFAAWERQLQADAQLVPDSNEDAPEASRETPAGRA